MLLLNIQSSPRGAKSASIAVTNAFLDIVPLVNSDQLDKLEFVALQSFAFRTCSNGLVRLPRRVLSEPGGPPVGDPGLRHQLGRAPALC